MGYAPESKKVIAQRRSFANHVQEPTFGCLRMHMQNLGCLLKNASCVCKSLTNFIFICSNTSTMESNSNSNPSNDAVNFIAKLQNLIDSGRSTLGELSPEELLKILNHPLFHSKFATLWRTLGMQFSELQADIDEIEHAQLPPTEALAKLFRKMYSSTQSIQISKFIVAIKETTKRMNNDSNSNSVNTSGKKGLIADVFAIIACCIAWIREGKLSSQAKEKISAILQRYGLFHVPEEKYESATSLFLFLLNVLPLEARKLLSHGLYVCGLAQNNDNYDKESQILLESEVNFPKVGENPEVFIDWIFDFVRENSPLS